MLESGVRIVAEHGLEALTLGRVGKDAGFSRGLPTHHFGTKQEFVSALVQFVTEEYRRGMDMLTTEPGLKGLVSLIDTWFTLCFKDDIYHCAMNIVLSEGGNRLNLDPDIGKLRNATIYAVEDQIRAGIKAKEIRKDVDPRMLTLLLLAAICGVLEYSLIDKTVDNVSAGRELVAFTINGIKA